MEKAISLFENYWCWYVLYLELRSVFNVEVSRTFLFALRSCCENPAGTKRIIGQNIFSTIKCNYSANNDLPKNIKQNDRNRKTYFKTIDI